jgi:putative OPT family oligopeptide transporter
MDPDKALAAPQAVLMSKIATGILGHTLEWGFVLIGMAGSVLMILIDSALKRAGGAARLPVLAVGIGLYLPPTVGVTLAVGAVLGWVVERHLRGRPDAERAGRRGVLIASGLIVGESLVGVAMAAVIGGTGSQAPLAIVGPGFDDASEWLGLGVFAAVTLGIWLRVTKTR